MDNIDSSTRLSLVHCWSSPPLYSIYISLIRWLCHPSQQTAAVGPMFLFGASIIFLAHRAPFVFFLKNGDATRLCRYWLLDVCKCWSFKGTPTRDCMLAGLQRLLQSDSYCILNENSSHTIYKSLHHEDILSMGAGRHRPQFPLGERKSLIAAWVGYCCIIKRIGKFTERRYNRKKGRIGRE